MHFLKWKCLNFAYYFTEVCSQGSNWQYPSIGPDNGLAPIRRQAIIWTNDGLFTDAYMRHSASNELNRPDCLNVNWPGWNLRTPNEKFNLCCPPPPPPDSFLWCYFSYCKLNCCLCRLRCPGVKNVFSIGNAKQLLAGMNRHWFQAHPEAMPCHSGKTRHIKDPHCSQWSLLLFRGVVVGNWSFLAPDL